MIKHQKILLGVSIVACFWALEPVRGHLGDHPGMAALKTTTKSLWGTLLLEHICEMCWYFGGDVFLMFSEPLSFHLYAPRGTHRTQFQRLLVTKFGTDLANLEKWKQWFRARGSIKIKPQGTSICTDFVICMYICSKPVFVVIPDLSLSHSFKCGYPFGLHFGQYVATIPNLISKHTKCTKLEFCVLAWGGYRGHIIEEGGTRRHPEGTQEAARRHPKAPRDTQEAPRRSEA